MRFKRSQLTDAVIVILRGVNDDISYSELAKRTKTTVPDVKRVLTSARRVLLNDKILFEPIIGFGLQRLTDSGKVLRSEKNKRRLKSGSRRSLKELETIFDYNQLTHDEQITVTLNRTLFELVQKEPEVEQPRKEISRPEPTNIVNIPRIK